MQQGVQEHQGVASDEVVLENGCSNRTCIPLVSSTTHCDVISSNQTTDNGDNRVTGFNQSTIMASQSSTSPHGQDSISSNNGQVVNGSNNGSVSFVDVREASVPTNSPNSPHSPSAIRPCHPCLPADVAVSPTHSSTSEDEEVYVHHKKFRRHRKRDAATMETTPAPPKDNKETGVAMEGAVVTTTPTQYDDSLCSEAKKNCNTAPTTTHQNENEQSHRASYNNLNETTNPKSNSSIISNTTSDNDVFEMTTTTSDKLCRATTSDYSSASVSSPSDASSTADDCDVMDTTHCDVTTNESFSYEPVMRTSLERGSDVFAVNAEQTRPVHTCGWQQCTRQFATLDELVNHVNDQHVRAERDVHYKCYWNNCPRRGKGFNARYKMLIHVRTHTNERPYKCSLCHKSFSRLENLKIHNRSHTGERPYVCPFEGCKKAYSNSSDRFKHVRTHQEQKPYSCRMPGCDKRYTDPSSLRKHIKTHGHYYRGPEEVANTKTGNGDHVASASGSEIARAKAVDEAQRVAGERRGDVFGAATAAENIMSSAAYLRSGFAASTHNDILLSTAGSSPLSSALTAERLLELKAREDFQNKAALLEAGGLFSSGLPLHPRHHPLLGLSLGYPLLPEASHYNSANHLSLDRSPSSLLMPPLSHNATDKRSFMSSLSTGSLSPGRLSDSAQSASGTDSDTCGSPPLPFSRPSPYESLYASSPPHHHGSASPKQSAFSPVSPSSPYSPSATIPQTDKYSSPLVPSRSPLVSRHQRHSPPVHHPYQRPAFENQDATTPSSTLQSSPVRTQSRTRPERPLDLSHAGSPMSQVREESPNRLLPGSSIYPTYDLSLHCHSVAAAPKCDLGPAFPALRLLNHA